MPIVSRPDSTRVNRAIASSASFSVPSSRRAYERKYSPAVESAICRPDRSNSVNPTCRSTSFSCIDTAGGVRCSDSAARCTLP